MKNVTFTKFRENASGYLDDVEGGETIRILRHGKAVAEITPPSNERHTPAWKRNGLNIVTKGASLSQAILDEREQSA